jgi:hypothetical protein
MKRFFYVYILVSQTDDTKHYTGLTPVDACFFHGHGFPRAALSDDAVPSGHVALAKLGGF